MSELARIVEALLFLAHDPVTLAELAEVTGASEAAVGAALEELAAQPARRASAGLLLREAAGGYTLASDPTRRARRRARCSARPRLATLTPGAARDARDRRLPAPVSRPEIARIRGVNADSPVATLLDRGLIEESGRSEFGAVSTARRRCS